MTNRIATNPTLSVIFALVLGSLLALALSAVVAFTSPALAVAGILALAAGVIVLSSIEFGLYAVIGVAALLPFASLPINLGFNPTFLDLALLAIFAMWGTRVMLRQSDEKFRFTFLGVPLLAFMTLALFSLVIGMSYAGLQIAIVRRFAEVLLAIATFFLIVNVVNTRARLEKVVRFMIIVGGISAALGIVFYFMPRDLAIRMLSLLRYVKYPEGAGVLRFINDDPEGTLRAISTSVDPNVLGGLMILVTALTAPQVFASKPLLRRGVTIGIALAMFVCLILTFSRGAFLGLGFALFVIAFVKYRRLLPLLILGLLIFLFAPFTQDYISHLLDAFLGADRATQMRLGEYKDAFELISRYPIFGVGFLGTPDIDTYLGVSSVYLLMAEQMGVVGVAVFLVTLAVYYWRAFGAWRAGLKNDPVLAPILLGITTALLGAMTAGVVDHYFFNLDFPHSVTLFWIFVGLGVTTIGLHQQQAVE